MQGKEPTRAVRERKQNLRCILCSSYCITTTRIIETVPPVGEAPQRLTLNPMLLYLSRDERSAALTEPR